MVLNQGVSIPNELFLAFVSKPAENWLMHQTNKPTRVGVNPDRVKIAFGTSWCVISLPSFSPAENQNLAKYHCPQESLMYQTAAHEEWQARFLLHLQ